MSSVICEIAKAINLVTNIQYQLNGKGIMAEIMFKSSEKGGEEVGNIWMERKKLRKIKQHAPLFRSIFSLEYRFFVGLGLNGTLDMWYYIAVPVTLSLYISV